MEKLLQILKHPFILTACVVKAFLLLFICASFANNGHPAKTTSLNTGPYRYKINKVNKKRILNVKSLPVPSISYSGGPFTFTVDDVISPMTAVSANVSAFGYNSVGTNVGSGLNEATSVAVDAAGNVYTDSFSFQPLTSKIYKISAEDGSKTELPWNNISNPVLLVDRQGNLYAGTRGTGEIFKYTGGTGTPEHVADVPCDIAAMVIDNYGNIYIKCFSGKIYKMAAGSNTPEIFLEGDNRGYGLAVDAEGSVYISIYSEDKVYKIPAGGGPRVEIGAGFNEPTGLVLDATGNLYVNDRGNAALKMIPAGNQQTTVTLATNLSNTYGLALDHGGSLYVARSNHSSIEKFSPTGGYFADKLLPGGLKLDSQTGTISGTPTRSTPAANYKITAWNGGSSAGTTINIATPFPVPGVSYGGPFALTVGEVISTVVPVANYVSPYIYSSTKQLIGSGLTQPMAVAVDTAGNVYCASWDAAAYVSRLYKISALDGSKTELQWNKEEVPLLAIDSRGNLYAAGRLTSNELLKYAGGGGIPERIPVVGVTTITAIAVDSYDNIYCATLGGAIYKTTPGAAGRPLLVFTGYNTMYGLAVDAENNVYVSSRSKNKVYKLYADGSPTVEIGTAFSAPMGLVLDAMGNLFVNDSGNAAFKMVPADNQQTTVTITAALGNPFNSVFDRTGNLYIADESDSSIVKYNLMGGYFADKLLPGGLKLDNQTGTISGTPTRSHPAMDYKISAHNIHGTLSTTTVNLSVSPLIPSVSYNDDSFVFKVNKAIDTVAALSADVSPLGYNTSRTHFSSGLSTPTSVAIDTAGNVYTNSLESSTYNKKIYKISRDGSKTEIAWSGIDLPKIATDRSGNLYAVSFELNEILKFAGGSGTPEHISIGGIPEVTALAVDNYNNIYIASYDRGVYKIPAAGGAPVLISGAYTRTYGLAFDAENNLYITDTNTSKVYKLPADGSATVEIGTGFSNPAGMAIDAGGNLYVVNAGTGTLKMIPAGNQQTTVTLITGFRTVSELAIDRDGSILFAEREETSLIRYDPSGGYFADKFLPSGLKLNSETGAISGTPTRLSPATDYKITAWNKYGEYDTTTVNIAVSTLFPTIRYIGGPYVFRVNDTISPLAAITAYASPLGYGSPVPFGNVATVTGGFEKDKQGNKYVLDLGQKKIFKYATNSTVAVEVVTVTNPKALTVDDAGNLYVADHASKTIVKVAAGTGTITTMAGGFVSVNNMCVARDGTLFVVDAGRGEIKQVPAGGGTPVVIDGGFSSPSDVDVDAEGNIYVADQYNKAIKKVWLSTDSHVETLYSGNTISCLAIDNSRNIFAIDIQTGRLFMIPADDSEHKTIASGGDYFNVNSLFVDDEGIIYFTSFFNTARQIMPMGGYFIDSELPAGLQLQNTTGEISGTPTLPTAPSTHKITAWNDYGETGSTPINIQTVSPDAGLSGLAVNKGTLSPAFNKDSLNYEVMLPVQETAIMITPAAANGAAIIAVNADTIASGTGINVNLQPGVNIINITVESHDEVMAYKIVVKRALSDNAYLSGLTLDQGIAKSKVRGTNYRDYTATTEVSAVRVTASVQDQGATIKINGETVTPGTPSAEIPLNIGSNTISTVVTAANGVTTNTYRILITRKLSSNAYLSGLTLDQDISKSKVRGTNYRDYTATTEVSAVRVTASVLDQGATIKINGETVTPGAPSAEIPLSIGSNTINTVVTAANGVTTNTYQILITRKPSSNAYLSGLTLDQGIAKSKVRGTNYRDYTATTEVSAVRVTASVLDQGATIKINGETVAPGAPSAEIPLSIGSNTINTVVTAANGVTTNTYQILITRKLSNTAMRAGNAKISSQELGSPLPEVTISKAVSPNGDSINDVLNITGIEAYADNTLQVMNNKGTQVTAINGYNNQTNAFDGRNGSGTLQPSGTYFYLLRYKDGKETRVKSGYFILKY